MYTHEVHPTSFYSPSLHYYPAGATFYRCQNAKDAPVTCTWRHTDGVTITVVSTVEIEGQLKQLEIDPNPSHPELAGKGKVTRSTTYSPTIIRKYTDGNSDQGIVELVNLIQDGKSYTHEVHPTSFYSPSLHYYPAGATFYRCQNAKDAPVTCTWRHTDGVTKTQTSIVEVEGQIAEIKIEDGEVTKSNPIFTPVKKTAKFTDGTVESNAWATYYISHSPQLLFRDGSNGSFRRNNDSPNGIVRVKWGYTDGVTIYGYSKIAVSGGANRDLEHNNGEKTDPEVAYNSSSKNKPSSGASCHSSSKSKNRSSCSTNNSNTCPPCGNTSAKVQGKSDNGNYQDGDPVNINNLEVVEEAIDMEIPGRGISFQFKRTYRSRIIYPSCYGFNWSHNYDRRFVPHPEQENVVVFYNGYARGDAYYVDSGSGNLIPPEYHFRKVIKDSDNSLLMRNNDGMILKFYPLDASAKAGHLAAIITRCGNRMTFAYNSDGQISTVYDSLSRPINYYYNSEGMLEKIADFTGRQVKYTYSPEGDLIQVTSPAITGTPNGNDFPEGKSIGYTYSVGNEDIRLNHNLLTVTRPNEVATNGPTCVVNVYDADDRLISQQWGGTNSSGISAGGTISYAREEVNTGVDPDNATLPREVVTIIDRNGNERVYYYNNHHNLIKKEEKNRGIRAGDPAAFVTQYQYTDTGLLKEEIRPLGDRTVYTYDENNPDQYQRGNLLSVTTYPDAQRGGDQQYLKVSFQYEPIYNRRWKVTEQRGNDPNYQPQNGGATSAARYTTTFIPDYLEGGLDTVGCACGYTLRQLVEKYDLDISSIQDQLNQGDLNGDGGYSLCGNFIVVRYPTVTLRADSPQAVVEGSQNQLIEKRWSYNQYGQIDWLETAEGEVAIFIYNPENDPEGDGQDIRTGNNNAGVAFNTTTGGYLKQTIADHHHSARYRGTTLPVQASSKRGYDSLGNIIWIEDSRGVRTQMVYNQLNQLVQLTRAADVSNARETGLVAYGYQIHTYYDFNNNVVKTEAEYRDGNNSNLPQWLEITYIYDILDNVLETTHRVDTTNTITQSFRYDANENVTEIFSPLAVAQVDLKNKVEITYDERGLLHQTIGAPNSGQKTVVKRNYDLNGNLVKLIGPEDNNNDGKRDFTIMRYDGFNRLRKSKDAVGNIVRQFYDPASNLIETRIFGPTGGPSRTTNASEGNVLLTRTMASYDELGRVYRSDTRVFIPNGVITTRPVTIRDDDAQPGDHLVTAFSDYDRNSRITFTTAPSPATAQERTSLYYDGLSRPIRAIDADGNQIRAEYDGNGNPVETTRIEVHPTGRIAAETFVTRNVYDSLNRLSRTTDNLGNTRRVYYDSRNLAIKTTDAQGPQIPDPLGRYTAGPINADGNATHIVHDGLGRGIQTIRELTVAGQGGNPLDLSNPANPGGKIIETAEWDANSRLIAVADDNGNVTQYFYDKLNRLTKTRYADGKKTLLAYDRNSQVIEHTTNNGSVIHNSYDAIGRLVKRSITRAAGVQGTTEQTFEYDGRSLLTRATDNNDPDHSSDDSTIERQYDSLGRLLEESQNGKVISSNWSQAADLTDLTYPNGRKLEYTHDKLNRLRTIANSGSTAAVIAAYDYIGGRMIERTHANATRLTTLDDTGTTNPGYDQLGRLVKMRHLHATTLIAGFGYGYNRESVKTYREDLRYPQLSELYHYDSLYRIIDFQRGTLNAGKDAITGTPTTNQTWQLDGVGNWANTVVDGETKTQTINKMNEYQRFAGKSRSTTTTATSPTTAPTSMPMISIIG